MKKTTLSLVVLFILISLKGISQDHQKIGITGTVQTSQFGVRLPWHLGEKFALVPSFGLNVVEGVTTEFGFALQPRFYFNDEKLAPYFAINIGMILNSPDKDNEIETESQMDMLGGASFGGEYFIDDLLSVNVEIQGNFTKSDVNSFRFGNPDGTNFNFATQVGVTLYFAGKKNKKESN